MSKTSLCGLQKQSDFVDCNQMFMFYMNYCKSAKCLNDLLNISDFICVEKWTVYETSWVRCMINEQRLYCKIDFGVDLCFIFTFVIHVVIYKVNNLVIYMNTY